jgi:hypothetical protein
MSDRGALWLVAGSTIGLQIWASLVLIFVSPSAESIVMTAVMKWPVLVILALLLAGPFIAWYRLVRVRARREKLKRAEWMLDGTEQRETNGKRTAGAARQWPLWETDSRPDRGG